MEDMKPHPITPAEWKEIVAIPDIRDMWGVEDDIAPDEFESRVYGARFNFISGGPGYVGDLFILQGDALNDAAPVVLKRDSKGKLALI